MATAEEVLGIIQGLAKVVKDQQATNRDLASSTQQQIEDLASSVKELSLAIGTKDHATGSPLRLPQLTLPEYTGKENLDRFAEQLSNVLSSSGVSACHWFTYLKQQCRRDARAFDIICNFESKHLTEISSTASSEHHVEIFENCLDILRQQRGIPRDQQMRQLLATYYAMSQQPHESVSDFSHRFLETQNSLEKLLPGIHRSSDGDLELIHAFIMKLKPVIAKHLLSRDVDLKDISHTIEAAKRYEAVETTMDFAPKSDFAPLPSTALLADRPDVRQRKPNFSGTSKPCWYFNKFHKAHCEMADNKCAKGYRHVCSQCFKPNCKLRFHNQLPTRTFGSSCKDYSSFSPSNSAASGKVDKIKVKMSPDSHALLVDTVEQVVSSSLQNLNQTITTSIQKAFDKGFSPSPSASAPPADVSDSQDPLFGMPAVPRPLSLSSVSDLDLANKNILWTKISSAGVSLPLPLDSCCSVSLVSQNHATAVAKTHPNLKFTKLEQQIPVSVAGPNSTLRAVGTMQVPIVWENGKSTIFTMLVVPHLTWPIYLVKTIFVKRMPVFVVEILRFILLIRP